MCVARPNNKVSDAPENNRQTESTTTQQIKTTQRNFRHPLSKLTNFVTNLVTNFVLTMELEVQITQFPKIHKRKRKKKVSGKEKGTFGILWQNL